MRQPVSFGKYLLLDRVSVGGMAEVFRAKSFGVEGFEKIVAIKRILPSMAEDAEFIQMFVDEAKIAGQLSHANIGQIFELGKVGDSHFIAMEFVWGKDLLQIQNRFRKLRQAVPIQMACFIGTRVCEGLDYAHRKKDTTGRPLGIIHRDVSPQNVLVSYEGEVKIIDFGIAKAASRSAKTQAGVLKGKFGYMSPEQVRGLPVDRRSDIFAIGTLMWEVLTGKRLFLGESDFATLDKVRSAEVEPPTRHNHDVPPALERIVMRALSPAPEQRYQWASELQDDLQKLLVGLAGPVYTAKQLSQWLKAAFADELGRERQALEQYQAATTGGAIPPGGRDADEELAETDAEGGEPPEKTLVGAPTFDEPETRSLLGVMGAAARGAGALEESPTELYGEVNTVDLPAHALPRLAGSGDASARFASAPPGPAPPDAPREGQASSQAPKVMVRGFAGPIGLPLSAAPSLAPFSPDEPIIPGDWPTASSPPSGGGQSPHAPALAPASGWAAAGRETEQVPRLPPPVKRSTIARDLAIGAAAAVVVAVLAASIYVFVQGRRSDPTRGASRTGSLIVSATVGGPGEVLVDGVLRGMLLGDEPLAIDAVPAGEHQIVVKRRGAPGCSETVKVEPGQAKVVACRFPSAAPGSLILRMADEGATVLVNHQEISADAAREPLPLLSGTAHAIEIKKAGFKPVAFTVSLRPGETVERRIELEPAAPAGAAPDDARGTRRRTWRGR